MRMCSVECSSSFGGRGLNPRIMGVALKVTRMYRNPDLYGDNEKKDNEKKKFIYFIR